MSKTTILIVEDEAIVAADLAGKLTRLGYEVAGIAPRGEEAIALADRLRPQLVLMDIRLKGPMDGIEATAAIRSQHDIPVIYLTAHSDAATLARAKLTGPFGYVLKPFDERDLATQIEMALYRHHADRQLRQQREWLRVTLTSIGDAVIATDAGGRVTFVNPVAEALTGWKAEEASGQPIEQVFRIVNEQTGQALEEPVARVLREGRAVELANHTALVTKDGHTVPIEDSAAPILDAAGQVIGAVLVFHDVTEKRRAEEALTKQREEQQVILDSTPAFIFYKDRENRFLRVNRAFADSMGAPKEELEGRSLFDIYPRRQAEAFWKDDQEVMASGRAKIGIVEPMRTLAGERWVQTDKVPCRDAQGNVIGVIGFSVDITERKRAEDALRQSEALLRAVTEGSPDPIFLKDRDSRIVLANAATCAVMGKPADQIIGKTDIEVYADPAVGRAVMENDARVMESGQTLLVEEVVPGPDGARTFLSTKTPYRDGDGRVIGIVGVARDITARKRAEKALRERERLLQDVIDGSTSPIFLKDRDGKFITINASLEKMLGMSRDGIKGKTDYDIAPKEVADYWRAHDTKVLATGKAIQIEEVANLPDGRHIFLADKFPLVDADGQVYGVGAISHDITKRKQAEETLRKSEQEFRALAEAVPQIVWATRPDGWNIYFNQQWLDYTGLTLDESYGHGWNTPFHPDDKQRAWDAWQRATQHNEPYLLECRLRRADGVYRWWLIHGAPMRDANGEIQKWLGTCTDIEEIKQAEERLRDSDEQFRTLADSIPNLAWWANGDGFITWYNRQWYEYTGTTPEQMEGWGWQSVHDPDELPRVMQRWKASIATGERFDMEFPLRRCDGQFRWFLTRIVPLKDTGGRVVRWFGTNTDVTEVRQARQAAEAANLAKSQFLTNMSHELRTPMNAILGMIDVALPKASDATIQDCLRTAKGSADLLLTLLNDLLDSAKIESGKLELESAPFSLRRMLDQITRVLSVRASEKGLCFYCRMPDETPDAVIGDRMRLQQVLLNLAGNAIKFTERGDVEVSLHAQSHEGEVCLEFAVRDTGIGIPPASLERLFHPFAQADVSMSRRFGGTGLGLTISKSLVEMMGGRIWVESELGKGSTFYFTVRVPLAKELPADFEAPVAVPAAACAQLRILLVEDNPANQKLATYILQDRGHLVEIAGDGQEAIFLTEENRYDVILMDVQMPGMDGLEATAAIRKREDGSSSVPIIAMTAHAMKGDRERCLAGGMDGYLSKPINAAEMIALVESLAADGPAAGAVSSPATSSLAAESPAAPVFDPELALKRCLGKRDLLAQMLQFFFDDADNLLPEIRAALQRGDLTEMGKLGHRLKGTIAHVAAEPAKEAAQRVEHIGLGGGTQSEAEEAVKMLERECQVLKAALAEHQATTAPTQCD